MVNKTLTKPAIVTPFPEIWRRLFADARIVDDSESKDRGWRPCVAGVRCVARRKLGSIVCGDRVRWQPSGESEGVVTAIEPAPTFWRAEEYHQRYLEKNSQAACNLGHAGGGR